MKLEHTTDATFEDVWELPIPIASHPGGGGGSELGWVEHQARIQDFLKGGGGEDIHKQPPLGPCPRDVINLKNAPTLGHSQAPPLGHCPCDVPHSKGGGGGDRSRSRTLCIGFQYRDNTPPPPDPPLNTIYRVWLGCLYHGRNKESSSNRRGWLISHSGAYKFT